VPGKADSIRRAVPTAARGHPIRERSVALKVLVNYVGSWSPLMSPVVYAAVCVVVPLLWGLMVVWVSNRIEATVARRRARSGKTDDQFPPTEYHI
jgi:hypothetical protein